ncbi:vacuolar protein sorting-associated protein 33B [Galendromus occidentalis]|uniref:Vacuolar protein sorting-associated protein 33B n=1 Tax=Galendromus occidentalis TaxID=34638 RepID=A0AAJ6QY31_9ACAR|nr:vacuolar protein sorting-associated protein 33B [Galendromus occidentalis]
MSGRIVDYISQYAETALLSTLENIAGAKDLLIEPTLIKSLDNIASLKKLRATGVSKLFRLEGVLPANSSRKCVFLVKGSLSSVKQVASIISSSPNGREFYLLGLPRLTAAAITLLESEGVFGMINLIPIPVSLIAIEDDVASLENETFFRDVFVHDDHSPLSSVALSLCQIEEFAKIGQVFLIGDTSRSVFNQWKLLRKGSTASESKITIESLVIFSRDADYVSLMSTQMNYSAILDDLFGIQNGKCVIPKSVTKKEERQINFKEPNETLSSIRDKHISSVFGVLSSESKKFMGNVSGGTPQSISGLKHFVNNELSAVTKLRSALSLHVSICEEISQRRGHDFDVVRAAEQNLLQGTDVKNTIELIKDCICSEKPWDVSLRLLCLLSLVQDGIPHGYMENLRTFFLHQYGHHYLAILQRLEKLEILYEAPPVMGTPQGKGGSMISKMATSASLLGLKESAFMSKSRKLGLIQSEKDRRTRTHSAGYVFNDLYVPLIAKLLESINSGNCDQLSKVLGGALTSERLHQAPLLASAKNVLVYFVGGASFGELAALRLVSKLQGFNIFFAATDLCGGSRFLNKLI